MYGLSVKTPLNVWTDWLIAFPLMMFVVASVDDKPFLSDKDWKGILGAFAMMFLGVLNNTHKNKFVAVCFGLLAFKSMTLIASFLYSTHNDLQTLLLKIRDSERKRGQNQRKILLASRKLTLASCLSLIVPVFPMAYALCASGMLSNDYFCVSLTLLSAVGRMVFVSFCLNAHLEVSHPAIALIDAENFGNTSRRAFIRYVFHEVRVPLNSIALGIQILANQSMELDKTMMDTLCMIRDAVNFMGDTLNDVMALQKVEEGALELIYKPFSIYDLFQNIQDTFLEISATSDVSLETTVDSNMPTRLIGDKFRIRHVLCNLVSNAIKFSKAGSIVRLTVESEGFIEKSALSEVVDGGQAKSIKFQVIDEGCGIPKRAQEDDIFTPFRQLKYGELTPNRGSGLGLAISREIVHMHGGQIYYVSVPGEGTTFTIVLPLEISTDRSFATSPVANFSSFAASSVCLGTPSTNHAHPITMTAKFGSLANSPPDMVVPGKPTPKLGSLLTPRRWRALSVGFDDHLSARSGSLGCSSGDTTSCHSQRSYSEKDIDTEKDVKLTASKKHRRRPSRGPEINSHLEVMMATKDDHHPSPVEVTSPVSSHAVVHNMSKSFSRGGIWSPRALFGVKTIGKSRHGSYREMGIIGPDSAAPKSALEVPEQPTTVDAVQDQHYTAADYNNTTTTTTNNNNNNNNNNNRNLWKQSLQIDIPSSQYQNGADISSKKFSPAIVVHHDPVLCAKQRDVPMHVLIVDGECFSWFCYVVLVGLNACSLLYRCGFESQVVGVVDAAKGSTSCRCC
jgi:signal transduction histidine kinase